MSRASSRGGAAPSADSANTDDIVNINGAVEGGSVSGTGIVISGDGLVLTNNHVVAGTTSLTAQVAGGGPVFPATVIGVDPTHDVAVVRLGGASGMTSAVLDTSGALAVGDAVTGLGNALGRNGAPVRASGAVTSLDETIQVSDASGSITETLDGVICFSARIEPGDSGGPLVNRAGRVVGMDTAGFRISTGSTSSGGCAIPITRAIAIAHEIIAGAPSPYIEGPHRAALGVRVALVASGPGVRVLSVEPGGAAALAGIMPGDAVTSVGGVVTHSQPDLDVALRQHRPGDRVAVTWSDPATGPHAAAVTLSAGPPL